MCIKCLNIKLESIAEYDKVVREYLDKLTCECCKSYPRFLLGVNNDMKILCLTKIKRKSQICPNEYKNVSHFECMVQLRIKNKLNNALESIDNCKEEINNQEYLIKMNELKDLNDMVKEIEEADHR